MIDQLIGVIEGSSQMNPLSQQHSRAPVHLEELKSAESTERTMSGHDKMYKFCHTDVRECGDKQTMCHLMTCGDTLNTKWAYLAIPTLTGVNCAKYWKQSI